MRHTSKIPRKDVDTFIRKFNNKCIKKDVEFKTNKILAELDDYAMSWESFSKKFNNDNNKPQKL